MKERGWLFAYTVIHFLVDLSCIYFLTGIMIPMFASHEEWLLLAVFYNIMAFAFPMAIGLLADIFRKNVPLSAAGCLCVAVGCIIWRYPYLSVFFMGLGNGMFHIGGGRQVLEHSKKHYTPCGVFISSGAMGVYFGYAWGAAHYPLWKLFTAAMLMCALFLWIMRGKEPHCPQKAAAESVSASGNRKYFVAAVMSLLIVVCIRSYYGGILSYSWKKGWLALIFSLCIAGGKMAGGILADKLGIMSAAVMSLCMAAVLAVFSFGSPVCGCASIFFFNMTMPLTLSLLAGLMPETQGFAFGILMFALFLGTLPEMLGSWDFFFNPAGLAALCLVSVCLLAWEIKAERKCVRFL